MDQSQPNDATIEHLRVLAETYGYVLVKSGTKPRPMTESAPQIARGRTAQAWRRANQIRAKTLGSKLNSAIAWEIVIGLYADRDRRIAVSDLAVIADAPPTTSLRWLHLLEEAHWVERTPDPNDSRRAFVSLTLAATMAIETALDEVVESDLRLGLERMILKDV